MNEKAAQQSAGEGRAKMRAPQQNVRRREIYMNIEGGYEDRNIGNTI
jgi:hypothetical protein